MNQGRRREDDTKNFIQKTWRKTPLVQPERRWEDTVKTDIMETVLTENLCYRKCSSGGLCEDVSDHWGDKKPGK
jgi:hypothetical protein